MSGELNALRHDLVEIATVAYGSGWRENTSGGEGHIGKIGNMIVKFNTHGDEYGNLSTLSDELREKMLASSDPLRETIIAIIDKALGLAGDGAERSGVLKEMRAALVRGKGKDLLTRKTAARAVTEIARFIDKAKPELKREQNGVSFKRSVWNEAKMKVKGAYMQSAKDTRADFEAKYDDYFERKAVASADMKRLKAFAALACGKDASSSGGSGYMGVRPDGTAVKFLTHPGERSAFARSGRDFPDSAVKASEKMKTELLELAQAFQRLKEAQGLFDEFEKDPANKGRPYTRELVAKVIDAIAKDNLAKTENGEQFKWENIRHADTVGDTTMETVFADELVESIMKDVWDRPETDLKTCGYTRTMAVEGDFQQALGNVFSVFSHEGDDENSRKSAFEAFKQDVTRGCKLFLDGTDVSGGQDSVETAIDKFFKADGANGAAAKNAVVQLASQQLHASLQPLLSGFADDKSGISARSPFPFGFTYTNDVDGASMESRLSRDDKGAYHLDVSFSGAVLMLLADDGTSVRNFAETGTNPTKMSVSLTLDLSFNEQGAAVVTVAKGGCISVQIPPQEVPQSESKTDGGRADQFQSYQMEIRNRAQEIRDAEVKLGTMTNERATRFDELVGEFAKDEAAACGLDVGKFKDSTALHKSLLALLGAVNPVPNVEEPQPEDRLKGVVLTAENLKPAEDLLDEMATAMLDLYSGELTDDEAKAFMEAVDKRKENMSCYVDDDLMGELTADKLKKLGEKLLTPINECAVFALRPHRRKMAVLGVSSQEARQQPALQQTDAADIFDRKVAPYRQAMIFCPAGQVLSDEVPADIRKFAEEAEAEARDMREKTIRSIIDPEIEHVESVVTTTFLYVTKLRNPEAKYPEAQVKSFRDRVEDQVRRKLEEAVKDDEATRQELQQMVRAQALEVFPRLALKG